MQEEGRLIGVRNNDGHAEEAAEIGTGKTFVRKKTQGCLPRPHMAGVGLGGQKDLGQWHGAPTEGDSESDNEHISKIHGYEDHELHRSEDALYGAWRDEEDLKLRQLMQANK